MKKTILPALAVATFAAHALTFGSTANAHTLYERGWWKNKTLVEVADGQRAGIDHSLAVVRFFEVRPHIVGPHRDRALAWHRTHLRITRRELAKTPPASRCADGLPRRQKPPRRWSRRSR